MKKLSLTFLGLVLLLVFSVTNGSADVLDNFDSYGTGALSAVSGGMWRTWNGSSLDAQVVAEGTSSPNAIAFSALADLSNHYPDVVIYNNGNLLAGGMATFSADFYVKSGNAHVALAFQLGSGDSSNNSIDYGSDIASLLIGYGATGSEVHLWDPDTIPGYFPLLTTVTCDAWHNLSLVVTGGTSGFSDVYVDGALVFNNYAFASLTNPNGFNAIELYTGYVGGTLDPSAGDGYLLDNISLTGSTASVPEPSTLFLLSLGLMGLVPIRKKLQK
jgi:hypothetical protein